MSSVMEQFATLLERNHNLKPMLEAITAQLKQRQVAESRKSAVVSRRSESVVM